MKVSKHIQLLFCVLFLTILVIPNLVMFFGTSEAKKEFPKFDFNMLSESVELLNSHYNEHFGLKSEMVNSYTSFKIDALNENPLPNRAIIGKNGWYFLGDQWNSLFKDSFGNYEFTANELEDIRDYLKTLKLELNSRGVAFYIVVPPNKHRVYSEELPFQLDQKNTRLEVLSSYLKQEIDLDIIDLRDALVTNKSDQLLYYKTNTHWNDIGAYVGYKKTMQCIAPDLPVVSLSEFNIESNSIKVGDVTQMLNLEDSEKVIRLKKKGASDVEVIKSKHWFKHFINPEQKKSLIMYRDSFANSWIPFFNESFGETIYIRGYKIDFKLIDSKKPDIVVFEIIERNLSSILSQKK